MRKEDSEQSQDMGYKIRSQVEQDILDRRQETVSVIY